MRAFYSAERSRLCPKCGDESLRNHAYCRACKNQWARQYIKNLPEAERIKIDARAKLNFQVKRGLITKQPCEICDSTNVQAHHEDYTRPYDVHWLCVSCHSTFHRQEHLFQKAGADKQLKFDFAI